ncbi:hypothetical protein [Hydrogenophaga sp.]|uniref:hypothetical protein n=1 Tax=Hydrogenophaga sp. TaxID=1904254 RepID=UPI002726BEE3|nr:hypothetical protein [Hydrogenophaga sp.]MDO8903952.1 hypothetical protein [Hydrogenophaga sp.]
MTTTIVYYRAGYRYQLVEAYEQDVAVDGIFPIAPGGNEYVHLTLGGDLYIAKGYAWDGASGPTINDTSFVRPSLVHDAHCQLWNLGVIDDAGRAAADRLLAKMLRTDALIIARRQRWYARWALTFIAYVRPLWVEAAVSWYSQHFAMKAPEQILTAP